jgi:hypothetical protein
LDGGRAYELFQTAHQRAVVDAFTDGLDASLADEIGGRFDHVLVDDPLSGMWFGKECAPSGGSSDV